MTAYFTFESGKQKKITIFFCWSSYYVHVFIHKTI